MANVGGVYPRVDMTGGSSRFPDMEQQVLKYWKDDDTFPSTEPTDHPAAARRERSSCTGLLRKGFRSA